ncbi:Bifunctional ligase/repressor BirA [Candidatus Hepatincola sp. Av]
MIFLCCHNTLPSTNTYVKNWVEQSKVSQEIAILANTQTAGVGKRSATWVSYTGNVHLSIVLDIEKYFGKPNWGVISLLVGTIVRDVLQNYIKKSTVVFNKWPNDIMVNNKKIAGILLELVKNKKGVEHIIIGIGVNLVKAPTIANYQTIALQDVIKPCISNIEFSEQVIQYLTGYLQQDYMKYKNNIVNLWLAKAYKLGEIIKVKTSNTLELGVFKGITPKGELILMQHNQEKYLRVGDILF